MGKGGKRIIRILYRGTMRMQPGFIRMFHKLTQRSAWWLVMDGDFYIWYTRTARGREVKVKSYDPSYRDLIFLTW